MNSNFCFLDEAQGDTYSVITCALAGFGRIVGNFTCCGGSLVHCGVCDHVFICVAEFESLVYRWCCCWNYGD